MTVLWNKILKQTLAEKIITVCNKIISILNVINVKTNLNICQSLVSLVNVVICCELSLGELF